MCIENLLQSKLELSGKTAAPAVVKANAALYRRDELIPLIEHPLGFIWAEYCHTPPLLCMQMPTMSH